ncbi:MAG: hypothetical protein C4519_23470 [Desulfobacteraceae bacterium]|nr:MAG: hypothetical protein C4519_23470 [Desulfobacteraceae bacterium]
MTKVISLDDKLKLSAEQRAAVLRKQKIMAVRKVFQCTHCPSKCERCSAPLGMYPREQDPKTPYRFCLSCAEEYTDYIQRLQGKGDAEAYWHNHDWLKAWHAWIEYQGAIDSYLRSKEFRRLLEELGPDDLTCE